MLNRIGQDLLGVVRMLTRIAQDLLGVVAFRIPISAMLYRDHPLLIENTAGTMKNVHVWIDMRRGWIEGSPFLDSLPSCWNLMQGPWIPFLGECFQNRACSIDNTGERMNAC